MCTNPIETLTFSFLIIIHISLCSIRNSFTLNLNYYRIVKWFQRYTDCHKCHNQLKKKFKKNEIPILQTFPTFHIKFNSNSNLHRTVRQTFILKFNFSFHFDFPSILYFGSISLFLTGWMLLVVVLMMMLMMMGTFHGTIVSATTRRSIVRMRMDAEIWLKRKSILTTTVKLCVQVSVSNLFV